MGKDGRPEQYRGMLNAEQVAAGMNAASRNARRLHEDASLLLENGRFPSAAALAILAIEEAGKTSILRQIPLEQDEKVLRSTWRDYRTHTSKNVLAGMPELVAKGARKLEDFRSLMDGSTDVPQLIDSLKQISIYSDCFGKAHWSEPATVVDEDLARMLVRISGILAKDREVEPREIELWIEHVGPVWKGEIGRMKRAVANWHRACCEEGLLSQDSGDMEAFLYRDT